MKFNTTVLVLAPGIGLAGSLAGGWQGFCWAMGAWFAFVAFASVVFLAHGLIEKANVDSLVQPANNRPFPTSGAPDSDRPWIR